MISVKEENVFKTAARFKEIKNGQELYFFRENLSLNDICKTKLNLSTLVVIGQQADFISLDDLSKLVYLRELWLVECNLKDISSLKDCSRLEKLYVYSNEIERIPNLSKMTRLAILSLSGNKIDRLTNIDKLENLKELNLADNKLKRLSNIFRKNCNLKYLNLAGNHLYRIKDVKNLRPLNKLESVVFNDPLYGDCPLTRLCNYCSYVLYWLPQINRLDHYPIQDAERHWIDSFFKNKILHYKILLHNNINVYLKSLKDVREKCQNNDKYLKDILRDIRTSKLKSNLKENEKLTISERGTLSMIEYQDKILKEKEEIASIYFQITCRQLKLHMRYCGNLYLREYKNNEEDLMKICQIALEKSLCPLTKKVTGITGIRLYRVTEVFQKEINEYRIWNDQIDESFHENEKSLKLLANTPGVRSIREWPMNVLKSGFYNQKNIHITNCLAIADAKFYDKLRDKIFFDLCEKRRVSILTRVPFHRCTIVERYTDEFHSSKTKKSENINRPCQMYVSTKAELSDRIFVAEYEYIFEKNLNDDEKEKIKKIHHRASSSIEHLTKEKILLFLRVNEEKFVTLKELSLIGQNIRNLQEDSLELPNLRELDLSYNRLEQFPNYRMIVNVKKINISFNEIRTIKINEKLLALEELDISWNCLLKCKKSLETLKMFSSNLKTLNFERNPFTDIVERDKIVLLTHIYFPKIENYCDSLDSKDYRILNLKMARNTLSELYDRHPTIFISHRSIVRVHLKKPSMHLVRLHLSDNCICDLDGLTQEHLPRLKYLDLTNNLITSLKPMGSYNTIVELYCAHNEIKELKEIENLQNWNKLQVIDLCYNPIEFAIVYKDFLIFHLTDLKYISGQCIQKSNVAGSRNVFGNILDQNMLLNINVGIKLGNLRQLDIVKCSIKKINLPSNLLPHLESLDLSRNQIISLESLNAIPKLKTLRLSYNHLETLQLDRSNNFDSFPNLSTLYLDHNRIGSITWNDDCHVFPTLKYLFLHHNKLANIYGLRQNSTLEMLIMDHNKIERINEDTFNENNKIFCLSIESNKIQDLNFVKRLSRLQRFYIADNLITKKDELEKLTLLENLEELTLSGNLFSKTINYYKFGLRYLVKIKSIDGFNLSNKTCACNDLSKYENVKMYSISEN